MNAVLTFIGCILFVTILFLIGVLLSIWMSRREWKKKRTLNKYYFDQKLFDADIPYNGPNFINRFETDTWDLRY